MSVNFFMETCKTESNVDEFGICDDPPPATDPAYINEEDTPTWIAIVRNPGNENVSFYAIDHCVEIFRYDGDMEKRCDGMLSYANTLIFVELKCREGGQWLKKGREQLTAIVNIFKSENNIAVYDKVEAYVCNSLRPLSHVGQQSNIQKFKNDTGLILKGKNTIEL